MIINTFFAIPALLAGVITPSPLVQVDVKAPDLQSDEWLNTDRPLKSFSEDLKGQVVLIDFWTYCCINCIHVLPDLKKLEEEFAQDAFQVIGVHSNKFPQEGEAKNIRQAILRYGIQHPVVVDQRHKIWKSFGVRSWPTLVLVDPEGNIIKKVSGEGNYETLRSSIVKELAAHKKMGSLADGPLKLKKETMPIGPLLYPGKVFAHGESLFVADSSHNRVVEMDATTGKIKREFLGANPPLQNPQGMAWHDGWLYIADTDNHLLRRLNLNARNEELDPTPRMETVAGSGVQARPIPTPGPGLQTPLNSPWALETDGDDIHIAMAGSHQLWTYSTQTGKIWPLAGSGYENIVDGPALRARLAQPSGLALIGRQLYFADSEVSAIRSVDLQKSFVKTQIGTHLFDNGDQDGVGIAEVKLQHPLGVAAWGKKLLIADTYNSKIKLLDPKTGATRTLYGGVASKPTAEKGEPITLWEPGGLAVNKHYLYIADTNHHRILSVDLKNQTWKVLIGPQSAMGEGRADG